MVHGSHDDFSSDSTTSSGPFADGYDRHKVYSAASDSKGHSVYMRVNVPTGLYAILGDLAASRCIDGIKTPADAIRDSLVHRAHDYQEMLETTDPLLAQELLDTAERVRAIANVEKVLEARRVDEASAEDIIRLMRETGIAYLPTAIAAAKMIRTEEFRDRVLSVIELYKKSM